MIEPYYEFQMDSDDPIEVPLDPNDPNDPLNIEDFAAHMAEQIKALPVLDTARLGSLSINDAFRIPKYPERFYIKLPEMGLNCLDGEFLINCGYNIWGKSVMDPPQFNVEYLCDTMDVEVLRCYKMSWRKYKA